jgi:hypothetical protein
MSGPASGCGWPNVPAGAASFAAITGDGIAVCRVVAHPGPLILTRCCADQHRRAVDDETIRSRSNWILGVNALTSAAEMRTRC